MTSAPVEPARPQRGRWWLLVVLIFTVQLALIWFVGRLSDRIGILRLSSIAFALLVPYFVLMAFVRVPLTCSP